MIEKLAWIESDRHRPGIIGCANDGLFRGILWGNAVRFRFAGK